PRPSMRARRLRSGSAVRGQTRPDVKSFRRGLLVAACELQEHAAFRNHFLAFLQAASNFRRAVLPGAKSDGSPGEFARPDFDVYKGLIFRIMQHGRNGNAENISIRLGMDFRL